MISGIGSQDVNFCAANNINDAQPQVMYVQQGGSDVVELTGKKKGKAKKGILATIGAAIVAVGALAWGVKSGKIQKVENPTNFLGKLKNAGFTVGSKACDVAGKCKDSKVGKWCQEKGSSLWDKVKGLFKKSAKQTASNAAVEQAALDEANKQIAAGLSQAASSSGTGISMQEFLNAGK